MNGCRRLSSRCCWALALVEVLVRDVPNQLSQGTCSISTSFTGFSIRSVQRSPEPLVQMQFSTGRRGPRPPNDSQGAGGCLLLADGVDDDGDGNGDGDF